MWPHCLLQGFPRQRRIVARHNGGTDLAEPEFPALAVECRVFFASGDLFSGWKRRWRGRGGRAGAEQRALCCSQEPSQFICAV